MYEPIGLNQVFYKNLPLLIFGSLSSAGQQIIFFNSSDSVIYFYNYNPFIQIILNEPVKDDYNLCLLAISPYGNPTNTQLIKYIKPNSDKNGSGLWWLWILLGIIGLIIIIVVGYFI